MNRVSEWGERRRRTAELVLALLDGTITTEEYWRRLEVGPPSGDEELDTLLGLVEHEPAQSRVLGLGPRDHAAYVAQIRALAQRIARRAEQAPMRPRHN